MVEALSSLLSRALDLCFSLSVRDWITVNLLRVCQVVLQIKKDMEATFTPAYYKRKTGIRHLY
jgi:hypothetical protein